LLRFLFSPFGCRLKATSTMTSFAFTNTANTNVPRDLSPNFLNMLFQQQEQQQPAIPQRAAVWKDQFDAYPRCASVAQQVDPLSLAALAAVASAHHSAPVAGKPTARVRRRRPKFNRFTLTIKILMMDLQKSGDNRLLRQVQTLIRECTRHNRQK
jgi:hypothetical protein